MDPNKPPGPTKRSRQDYPSFSANDPGFNINNIAEDSTMVDNEPDYQPQQQTLSTTTSTTTTTTTIKSTSTTPSTTPSQPKSPNQRTHIQNSSQPGISTPSERILEAHIPQTPLYAHAYPHYSKIIFHCVSKLGYMVTATDDGSINIWHLGEHQTNTTTSKSTPIDPNLIDKNQLKFIISLPLHTSQTIISLSISSCGTFCVSLSSQGHLYVLNLRSTSVDKHIILPFIPTCSVLLQSYLDPELLSTITIYNQELVHYQQEHNLYQNSNLAQTTQIVTPNIIRQDTQLSICIGSITGHIFLYSLSSIPSSVCVSTLSQSPLTSITAIPLHIFATTLQLQAHKYTLGSIPTSPNSSTNQLQYELCSYPFLNKLEGFILFTTDVKGNIDISLIPTLFTLPIHFGFADPTRPTPIECEEPITLQYNIANPHNHGILSNKTNFPTYLAVDAINRDSFTIFWGSLTHNILIDPFKTVLFPHITMKSQTDLFKLRKDKKVAISIQIAPNGHYFSLSTIPLTNSTTTTNYFTHYIFSTHNLQIIHTFNEDPVNQYPNRHEYEVKLTSKMLYHMNNNGLSKSTAGTTNTTNPLTTNTLLESRFAYCDTDLVWSTVQLDTSNDTHSTNMNDSTRTPLTMTTVFNPFYTPHSVFNQRLISSQQQFDTIYTNQIIPLTQIFESIQSYPTQSTQSIKMQLCERIISNSDEDAQHYALFTSTYKPLFGTAHTTSSIQTDLLVFDPTSTFCYFPTVFGIKTIRLRDGFCIFGHEPNDGITNNQNNHDNKNNNMISNSTTETNDLLNSLNAQINSPPQSQSSKVTKPITKPMTKPSLIGNTDIIIDPLLIFQQLSYILPRYYATKSTDKLSTSVSIALSHNTTSAPLVIDDDEDKRQKIVNGLQISFSNKLSHQLLTTCFSSGKLLQYPSPIGLPCLLSTILQSSPLTSTPISLSQSNFIQFNPLSLQPTDILKFNKWREVLTSISKPKVSQTAQTVTQITHQPLTSSINATIHTNFGDMTFKLYQKQCPKAVENFVGLSNNGFYNGLIFHRVIQDFMIQGGCKHGTGMGSDSLWGPNVKFEDEFNPLLKHDAVGTLACANNGPNTNGSQFYIQTSTKPLTHLDNKHTVFGKLTHGNEVLQQIANVHTDNDDRPREDVKIISISIEKLE